MDVKEFLTAVAASDLPTWINTTRGAFAVVEALHVISISTVFGTIAGLLSLLLWLAVIAFGGLIGFAPREDRFGSL
jgi:hypothetical protein